MKIMKIMKKYIYSRKLRFSSSLVMIALSSMFFSVNVIADDEWEYEDGTQVRVIEATAATGMNRLFGQPIARFPEPLATFGFTTIGAFNPGSNRPAPLTNESPDSTLITNFVDIEFVEFFFLQPIDPVLLANINIPMRQLPVANDVGGANTRILPGTLETDQMTLSQAEPSAPITLGDWLKARGTLTITCPVDGPARVHASMTGLIPNRFFTFLEWFRPAPGSPFVLVPGIFGGIPGTVASDEDGNAEYSAILNICPPMSVDDTDHRLMNVVLVLQTDHQSYGGTPAAPVNPIRTATPGETASVQLYFPFTGERLIGPSPKLDGKKDKCESVELLSGDLQIQPPFSPAIGPANFIIDGKPALAEATVSFFGPPEMQNDGTQSFTASIRYDFSQGNILNALAHGTLTAKELPGTFINTASIRYVGGTGIYASADGTFSARGDISFADLTVNMEGEGVICGREKI